MCFNTEHVFLGIRGKHLLPMAVDVMMLPHGMASSLHGRQAGGC